MATLLCLLRNLFAFPGYKVLLVENGNRIVLRLKNGSKRAVCPSCRKRCRHVEAQYLRDIRDLDMVGRMCFLRVPVRKIKCKCGYRGVELLDFVDASHRLTKRFENYVTFLCEVMSIKDVAAITRLDWKTIKKIDMNYIKSQLPDIMKLTVRRIAMDEIAIQKGHKYATIIRDYDTGVVIKIVLGRGYNEVRSALMELGKEKLAGIKFVSMDMWDPYIKAIRELCPQAKIVFDKFHVVKKVNEALDTVRKNQFADASPEERKNMKHKRFVILKKESNLKDDEKDQLRSIMASNEPLYMAYLLKEQLMSIFDEKEGTFEQIRTRLNMWMENILSNQLEAFYNVVNTIQTHLEGVLNYFRYGMTNAIAEGFNTKINIIKRRAYGFRDIEYFTLKIFQSSLRRLS